MTFLERYKVYQNAEIAYNNSCKVLYKGLKDIIRVMDPDVGNHEINIQSVVYNYDENIVFIEYEYWVWERYEYGTIEVAVALIETPESIAEFVNKSKADQLAIDEANRQDTANREAERDREQLRVLAAKLNIEIKE